MYIDKDYLTTQLKTLSNKIKENFATKQNTYTKTEVDEELDKKQPVLIPGDNITIEDDVISASGGGDMSEDLTATVDIGSVTSGKKYPAGTALEDIIRDMLIKVEKPAVALSLVPSTAIYDIVEQSISAITLKAVVTKKTYGLKSVKFYAGDTLIDTQTITAGGTYTYNYSPATPIKTTTIFKAIVEDAEGQTNQNTVTVSFVGKSYYGTVASDIGEPTEAQIKVLSNNVLKTTKTLTYSGITTDFGKVCYAYPKSFETLTSIKDPVNNYDYTNSFTRISVVIDGIDYYCYTQTIASAAENVKLTFA